MLIYFSLIKLCDDFISPNNSVYADAASKLTTSVTRSQKAEHWLPRIRLLRPALTLLTQIFTLYILGEPSDATGARCAYMNGDSGKWSTDDCSAKRPFVCMVSLLNQLAPKPCSRCFSVCPTVASTETNPCLTHTNTSRMPLLPDTTSPQRPTTSRFVLPVIVVTPLVFFTLLGGALFVAYRQFCESRRTNRSR